MERKHWEQREERDGGRRVGIWRGSIGNRGRNEEEKGGNEEEKERKVMKNRGTEGA